MAEMLTNLSKADACRPTERATQQEMHGRACNFDPKNDVRLLRTARNRLTGRHAGPVAMESIRAGPGSARLAEYTVAAGPFLSPSSQPRLHPFANDLGSGQQQKARNPELNPVKAVQAPQCTRAASGLACTLLGGRVTTEALVSD